MVGISAPKRSGTLRVDKMVFFRYTACTDLKVVLDEATGKIEADEIYFVYSSVLCSAHHRLRFVHSKEAF